MRAVVLLSGGLDSVVSMLLAMQEMDICLAVTIDYCQKARDNEIRYSAAICARYGIPHQVIELPFMKQLKSGIIEASDQKDSSPWVPNRNGIMLNLAAGLAENLGADWVICGFNRDEGLDFPDNTAEYIEAVNRSLYYSTLNHVQVKSYVQNMSKHEIAQQLKTLKLDPGMLWSCYRSGPKPCGECPSCIRNNIAYEKAGIKYD